MFRVGTELSEKLLAKICDCLIPGDGDFPAASEIGVQRTISARGARGSGIDFTAELRARFATDWENLDSEQIADRLAEFECEAPDEFQSLLMISYLSYYESQEIKNAIRKMGLDYNDRPQPDGYDLEPFDPENPLESPRHRRGHFVATHNVERVSREHLGNLLERVG